MRTLIDLFGKLEKFRHHTACVYRSEYRRFSYTYGDIIERSLAAASWMQEQGLENDDRVMIWAPNGPDWITVFWGTILAGGIVVPVDLLSMPDQVSKIENLTQSRFLFKTRIKPDLANTNARIIQIDRMEKIKTISHVPMPCRTENDTAEIIYTSGTTGDPKGVVIKHKHLVANIKQIIEHIQVKKNWKFLSLLPMSHLFEQTGGFLVPFSQGSQIVYVRALKPSTIFEAIKEERVHVIIAVPRLLKALRNGITTKIKKAGFARVFALLERIGRNKSLSTRKRFFFKLHRIFGKQFQFFVSGGAALDPRLEEWWRNVGFTILQGYGLTECSPVLAANQPDRTTIGSAGKALPGVRLRIAPDGEVLAKGPNIFEGYYRNPLQTREAFTDDGWFKTGDIGEIDANGFLFLKSRKKDVIVTDSGVNVYPQDIENVLTEMPGVNEAAVVEKNHAPYAVLALKEEADGNIIIQKSNSRLNSSQKIIGWSAWPEAEFPKTTTMKIKKQLVRAWLADHSGSLLKRTQSALRRNKLYALLARVTNVSSDRITPNMKLVGGLHLSSIDRLELASLIGTEFYLEIDESAITPDTTVGDLERMVRDKNGKSTRTSFRTWQHGKIVELWRKSVFALLVRPITEYYCHPQAVGLEHLAGLHSGVLFAPNHLSHLDQPCVLNTLPENYRHRTLTAARSEFFGDWDNIFEWLAKGFCFEFCTTVLNVFPISQTGAFKSSLLHAGKMIDKGYSIMLFPEGRRPWDGSLQPFKQGVAILARELKIPVIPIKIEGIQDVFPRGAKWPKRGRVTVKYGKAMFYNNCESLSVFTERLRNTILYM